MAPLGALPAVPFYGYWVHAARDPQSVALVILLCWLLTCVAAVGATAWVVVRPPPSLRNRHRLRVASACLLVAAVFGAGGVRAAVSELLAG
jgi:hypothetical protein